MSNDSNNPGAPRVPGEFPDTRWSQVVLAGEGESAASHQALEQLCQSYWQPIYGFLRRKGYAPHDAEDLTQQFFLRLLKGDSLARAERSKGRFRTFLLGALHHFLADEFRKSSAQKRGGTNLPFVVNFREAEERYLEEPDPNLTPEQMYDRRWAAGLLQRAFESLSSEFESAGLRARFDRFKVLLANEPAQGQYERLASELGMTRRAVGAAVYRMRQRYRQLVRGQVADTVAQAGEIDAELAQLFG
jgi:RNA polymerase sigma factor (sigma-70 family)